MAVITAELTPGKRFEMTELTLEERFEVVKDTVVFVDELNGVNVNDENYDQELTNALARFALTPEGKRKFNAVGYLEWR